MSRRVSVASSIIKKLTPSKSKDKKDKRRGRGGKERRRRYSSSSSSSYNSYDEDSGDGASFSELSDLSHNDSRYDQSYQSSSRYSGSGNHRGRDRGDNRRRRRRGRHRSREDRYSYTRYHSSRADEAETNQILQLLRRVLSYSDDGSKEVVASSLRTLPASAIDVPDEEGNTLLMLACQSAAWNALPVLLSKGADVNAQNASGATSLHFACFAGESFSPETAVLLLRSGAAAEVAESEFGCTPLHWAAFSGHLELCKALCQAGGVPTRHDKNGCDPIHYAEQNGHPECAQFLRTFRQRTGQLPAVPNVNRADQWVRCLDGTSQNSFYHNNLTGESLWGEDYRRLNQPSQPPLPSSPPPTKGGALETPTKHEADSEDESHAPTPTDLTAKFSDQAPASSISEKNRQLSNITEEIVGQGPKAENGEPNIEVKDVDSEGEDSNARACEDALGSANIGTKERPALTRLNSWDADFFYANEGKSQDGNSGADEDKNSEDEATSPKDDDLLPMSPSFEMRIANLHQKMEDQLLQRMQGLENAIKQQNVETAASKTTTSSEEDTATILQLRTDLSSKDLEILQLKQSICKMETDAMLEERKAVHLGVGDGNVHVDPVRDEIVELRGALGSARSDLASHKQQLEIAQQLAKDEQASRALMKTLLEEQSKKGEESDSRQEGKERSDETISQLNDQIKLLESKLQSSSDGLHKENAMLERKLESKQAEISQMTSELEKTVTALESASLQLKSRKDDIDSLAKQLEEKQNELNEEKISRMEVAVAKDESVDAMHRAVNKAREVEARLKEMKDFISKADELEKTNEQLHVSLSQETEKRKVLHNTLEDLKGRIRVYVRIRPLSESELNANFVECLSKEDDRTVVMAADEATAQGTRDWEFDKIFSGNNAAGNTQEAVFKDTSLLITSVMDGFNVCIFAYGQTGSGKTFTMLGGSHENQGIMPRTAHEIFNKLQSRASSHRIEVSASMLELYTDKLRDLLVAKDDPSDLKIRLAEHTESGLVEVDGALVEHIGSAEELLEVFDRGSKGRASSSTKMNAESSRSHLIVTIVITLQNKRTGKAIRGKLTLVDLAGSERVSKSGATGHQLKEAQSINKSLSALGDVIGALTSQKSHIPYRNHPLTMLMSDSIGGNSKTLLLVCCSPADYNRRESTNSLDFAKRCRNVTNKATKGGSNESSSAQIKALRAELSKLKKSKEGSTGMVRRGPRLRRPG